MAVRSRRAAARARACAFAGLSALLLAACGGGGGGSGVPATGGDPSPAPAPSPAPSPAPAPSPVATAAIVGTAATGAPLANATVSLKCVSGSFAATADARGEYRIGSVPVDSGPCLLRAQGSGAAYVAPVASLGGGTVVANATPLTHLLSSRLLGQPADLAFQNAGPATLALVEPAAISAARGQVRSQLDRLGIPVPGLSSDWVAVSFSAQAGDPHDDFLEALDSALARNGLTVAAAASQLAASDPVLNLPPGEPAQACAPALIDGFAAVDRSKWIKVAAGPMQADGIGIGGGPGLVRGASVSVSFADGTVLQGARTDAATGMVTLVPCALRSALPALIRLKGEPGSTYYDAGSGQWTSFEGQELHGLVQAFEPDRNLAVTPFTEAVYQRVLAMTPGAVAGRLAMKDTGQPWQDPGRIEVAHDEVLAAVNDQLPGVYRLGRLDRMPLLLDEQGDTDGSETLPKTPEGIHGAVVAGFAKAAAASRPDDPAPALAITERFAADMADGRLDDPLAGLDPSVAASTVPAYSIDSLWHGLTTRTTHVAHRSGRAPFRSDLPFPLALVNPSGYRVGDLFGSNQYIGLFSDGILRVAAEVPDSYNSEDCFVWCNPVRKVPASPTSTWWVFEIGRLLDFDPDNRIGRLPDGRMVMVGTLSSWSSSDTILTPINFAPLEMFPNARLENSGVLFRGHDNGIYRVVASYDGSSTVQELAEARGLRSLAGMPYGPTTSFVELQVVGDGVTSNDPANGFHLFGIDAAGQVQRLVYEFRYPEGGGASRPVLRNRSTLELPGRARQLTSDGRLVHALLSNGDVYVINPEIIVAGIGHFPIEGAEGLTQYLYRGNFAPAGYPAGAPRRIEGTPEVCRVDGVLLIACDGRLLQIDRQYFWQITSISHDSVRAPGKEYSVRQVPYLDSRGWRAFKAPLTLGIAWDASVLRLLATTDGSYVLQADSFAITLGPNSYDVRGVELSQQVIESWLR